MPAQPYDPKALSVLERKEQEYAYQLRTSGQEVIDIWDSVETQYSQLFNRMSQDRSFYDGDISEQWTGEPEGNVKLVFNLGATVIDLYTYMLTNTMPQVQWRPPTTNQVDQAISDYGETLANKMLFDAEFRKKFKDSARQYFMLGHTHLFPFWNKEKKEGGPKGSFDISALNPFTTRVVYSSSDYDDIECFVTWKRMRPESVKRMYGADVVPDSEVRVLPKSITVFDDGMTSVFRKYDREYVVTVANGMEIDRQEHGLGFVPLVTIDNSRLVNDVNGSSEIKRWKQICQEINALLSAVSEIARDVGYPPLLEYNKALSGKSLGKIRGKKIPVKRSDNGEALEYLSNPAQIQPLIAQVELLIDLFHFVSLMPKAASGVFPNNVTSGFQAKLSMQPATLSVTSRQIDWETAIRKLIKMGIKILKKNNPEAFKVPLDGGQTYEIEGIETYQIEVIFSDNLPVDVAREIQNLTLGLQNNLTSLHQAIDRYNALLDLGATSTTVDYLKQESGDADLSPDRVMKIVKAKAQMTEIGQKLEASAAELEKMRGQIGKPVAVPAGTPVPPTPGEQALADNANANNLALSATNPLPEEQRPTPETAREAVNPNSTGGTVLPPVAG